MQDDGMGALLAGMISGLLRRETSDLLRPFALHLLKGAESGDDTTVILRFEQSKATYYVTVAFRGYTEPSFIKEYAE